MIINFSVKNFGPIKDKQTLSFEADRSTRLENAYVIKAGKKRLLKLALIYGANASGKTSLLEALDFMRNLVILPKNNKTEEFDFEPFLFDPDTPHMHTELSIEFIQDKIRYLYEVKLNKNAIVSEELFNWNPNRASLYERTTDLSNQLTKITFGSTVKINSASKKTLESNTLWNNTVVGGYLKTNIDFNELKSVFSWFNEDLKPLIRTNTQLDSFVSKRINSGNIKKPNVIEILKKADFHISDIEIKEKVIPENLLDYLSRQPEEMNKEDKAAVLRKRFKTLDLKLVHTVNDKEYSLPFKMESSGTKRYYGFAGLLAFILNGSNILSIDELESSLHPDLYEHFLLSFLMNSKDSQIIATTHNREILNKKDLFRNDAIWFTEKNDDCATELYSLADFDSSVVRDSTNVLNAYKSGKLGATPNTADYFLDLD